MSIQAALDNLCALRTTIDFDDDDGEEYEEPSRRLLRHWCGGKETLSVSPSQEFYAHYEIRDVLRDAYQQGFEAAWRITMMFIDLGPGAGDGSGPS